MTFNDLSVDELSGHLIVNGEPAAYYSFDQLKGRSLSRPISIKYVRPVTGQTQARIMARYKSLSRNGTSNWEECGSEKYEELLDRFSYTKQLGIAGSWLHLKDEEVSRGDLYRLQLHKKIRLIFAESTEYKEICDFVTKERMPENSIIEVYGEPINLFSDRKYDNIIARSVKADMINTYLGITKTLNARIGYSNLILPNQIAYLPFMYSSPYIRNPIEEFPEINMNYKKLFRDIETASFQVQLFENVDGSELSCKVIPTKVACELLGFDLVYPMTGYMLLALILIKCSGLQVDIRDVLRAEVGYFRKFDTKVKNVFQSYQLFLESFENNLNTVLNTR